MSARTNRLLAVLVLLSGSAVRAEAPSNFDCIADEDLCRKAKVAPDGPALVEFFRKRTPTPADRKRIAALIEQLDDTKFQTRQEATRRLVEAGAPAVPLLRQAIPGKGLELAQRARRCIEEIERATPEGMPAAAARLIKVRGPRGACPVLLAYLPFVDDETVEDEILEALLALGAVDGRIDPALSAALAGKAAAPRSAAALVIGRFGDGAQRDMICKLLADKDPRMRLRAAQGLTARRDPVALPVLIALLAEAPLPLAQQAEDLLSRIGGEKLDILPLGDTDESRRKCRDAWAWWKANTKTIDLARADVAQPITSVSRRAREVTGRLINALIKGDQETLSRTTDVPFCLAGILTIETRKELDALFKDARSGSDKRTLLIERVVRGDEYGKLLGDNKMRDFLGKLRQPEIRAVYVTTKEGRDVDRGVVIVRVAGSQARVIGLGEHPETKK
jgi:HEAT repeat protein